MRNLHQNILGLSRSIYKIIKILQKDTIIILLFYVILYRNLATILNTDSCMIYMTFHVQLLKYFTNMGGMWHVARQNNFTHDSLGHAIKHG